MTDGTETRTGGGKSHCLAAVLPGQLMSVTCGQPEHERWGDLDIRRERVEAEIDGGGGSRGQEAER